MQEAALHCESTVRLAQVVREVTPIYDDGWPEDEPESRWRLREVLPFPSSPSCLYLISSYYDRFQASLTALACCALEIEDIRRSVLKLSPPLLPLISISLTHPKNGVRYGAAQCARTMSRSVSLLRTCFGESDISMRLLDIVKGDGETDTRVRNVALMAIANLIHDFAPSRVVCLGSFSLLSHINRAEKGFDAVWDRL